MWYRTGTISVSSGSDTVTGLATLWKTMGIKAGDVLAAPDGLFYEITSATSETSLKIKTQAGLAAYQGVTATGQAYSVIRNFTYSTNADLAERVANLLIKWQARQDEVSAWQAGTATGGPHGDGTYPLTDATGNTAYIACPDKIAYLAGGSEVAKIAAEAARDEAVSAKDAAAASAAAASTSETNAKASELSATQSESSSAASAQNAASSATAASGSASAAATSEQNAAISATQAADAANLIYAAL